MPALSHLLTQHPALLLLDAASQEVKVGLFRQGQETLWEARSGDAGVGLFAAVEEVLARGGMSLNTVDAFCFCNGPGSALGIRTVAMALRTWNATRDVAASTYSFCSLEILARGIIDRRGPFAFSVIADARRGKWHCVDVDDSGGTSALYQTTAVDLIESKRPLLHPESFRSWGEMPGAVEKIPYDLAELCFTTAKLDLYRESLLPDVLTTEPTIYKLWTADIHLAPPAKR